MDAYDVIIVGTGAGGGTLAHRLAPSGKRVLLLERGGYLPRERDNWDSTAVFLKGQVPRRRGRGTTGDGDAFTPENNYYVGGNTKFYGAALFRLRPRGLRRAPPPRRHLAGLAARATQDLEPYYAEAEHLYVVHGARGEDPTEGPAAGTTRTRRSSTSRESSS